MRDSKGRESERYPEGERRTREPPLDVEPVVLTHKYAGIIDGISLVGREVGDRLALNHHDANLLVAEGWARPVPEEQRRHPAERGRVNRDYPRRDEPV